jgi:hypothetical protein
MELNKKLLLDFLRELKIDFQLTETSNSWRVSLFEDQLQINKEDTIDVPFIDVVLWIINDEDFI